MASQWFESWFASPYYPLLYAHRDAAEAEAFVGRLADKLPPRSAVLDAPCGNGRHACALAKRGFFVTGIDLSPTLLDEARRFESPPQLVFFRHDLRQPFHRQFDAVLNLFTGFGYFDDPADDRAVFDHLVSALLPSGLLVIDFFNADYVLRRLVAQETIIRANVRFDVQRRVDGDRVVKTIRVTDADTVFHAQEKVRLYTPEDFRRMTAGLTIQEEWGDYSATPFDSRISPRYILLAKKLDV
jgi:SAM-dependent methyltransferase